MENKALIVFLKYPENGKVKTRLAKNFDESFATKFYKLCVERLIAEFNSELLNDADIFLYCSDIEEIDSARNWLGTEFIYRFQQRGNLGIRMWSAFEELFKSGYKKAVIVGTDIPDLNSEIINNSFELLNKYDSVIGPSTDGGYYLLGIKQNHPELFEEINWSTNSVLNETLKRLENLKFSNYLLNKLIDIDTADNLSEWIKTKKDSLNEPLVEFTKRYLLRG